MKKEIKKLKKSTMSKIMGKGLQHTSFTLPQTSFHVQDIYDDANNDGKLNEGEKVINAVFAFGE